MTDAQQLFDYARQQFNDIADHVDRHFDLVTHQLREWMPADLLPTPPPKRLPPPTTFQIVQRWVNSHKALTVAAVAFLITGSAGAAVYVYQQQHRRKRRAKKSASGARTEVVVVAGSVANPLTSALYLDLERRGFVVYVVTNTSEDERYIRSQSRADVLPLQLDLVDPFAAQEQLSRFSNLLAREHRAFEDAEPHKLSFVGLILVPDTHTSAMRIEDISSEEWSDALNAKVLNTIATTQLFLPALAEHKSKILLLTPSVTPALRLPMHAVQNTVYGALEGFTSSLAAEVRELDISVSHFKLGNIDIPLATSRSRTEHAPAQRVKATPVRKLHDCVFDTLVSRWPARTYHVGRGSLAYDVIGRWAPVGVVGYMMGASKPPKDVEIDELNGSWEKVEEA